MSDVRHMKTRRWASRLITIGSSAFVSSCCAIAALASAGEPAAARGVTNAFFAMDTGTKDARHQTASAQVEVLKELGYAGYGHGGYDGVPEMLAELDKAGLRMFTDYLTLSIDAAQPEARIKGLIGQLKGHDTILWLALTSSRFKPSSTDGDEAALVVVRGIADLAKEAGLRVALYPHTGFWLERVDDAVRLAKKSGRPNLGATFNLCHWLKVEGDRDPQTTLQAAMPQLFVVTINGADRGDTKAMGWDRLIQTLDRGSFDAGQFLKLLKELGYTGPVGLQAYGIGGDAHDNLQRSMEAWRKLSGQR